MWKTADLCDAHGDAVQVCALQFQSYGNQAAFFGRVATVASFEDNVLIRQQLSTPGGGRVLVADTNGSMQCAVVGDSLAGLASENNWAGIVVNGCVRDVATLAKLDIGVLALGRSPRKCSTEGRGASGLPVSFGAVQFLPGAWIYCDRDGVIVSDQQLH